MPASNPNVRVAAVTTALAMALAFGLEAAHAWEYWMDFTGPTGGNWNVPANWTDINRNPSTLPTPAHHVPGFGGFDDFKAEVNGKTVHVNDDRSNPNVAPNHLTYYRFYNGATIEIESGGKLGGATVENDGTAVVNVRNGGSITDGSWAGLNTYAGSTVGSNGTRVTLAGGTNNLNGGTAYFGTLNPGNVIQDGASVNFNGWTMLYNGTYYQMKSGDLAASNLAVGRSGATLSPFTMAGGTVSAGQTLVAGGGDTGNGLLDVSGGSFSGGSVQVGNSGSGTGRFRATGAAATVTASTLTVGANGTLEYILDDTGVSKVTVSGATTFAGALTVDVTDYADTGIVDLLSYGGALTGAFGAVSVLSNDDVAPWPNLLPWGTYVEDPLMMPQGYYYLNYGDGTNDTVRLVFNVHVPEPGALSLLAALGGVLALRRRRL